MRPAAITVATGVLLFGFNAGVRKVVALADERGSYEIDKDTAPAQPKKHRTSIVTVAPPAAGAGTTTTTRPAVPPQPLTPMSAEASSVAESASNGCGQSTSYEASQILDGDPNTAWRAVGDGRNVTIVLTLAEARHITEVGLIPGYDKTDQCTGIDRFVQMRRITKVRWSFDDGTNVEQTFADERSSQSIPVNAVSTHIRIDILATTASKGLDYTAISDVRLAGTPS
jgi:hypothetical protein